MITTEKSRCIDSQKVISVIPMGPFDTGFSYLSDFKVDIGDVVEVPFGKRKVIGVVVEKQIDAKTPLENDIKLKNICKVFPYNIGKVYCEFSQWVSSYNLIPRGYVLKMILGEKTIFSSKRDFIQNTSDNKRLETAIPPLIQLNGDQENACKAIVTNKNKPFLLHGVTGSGKTEIYLAIVRNIINNNMQTLILLPEMILMDQISRRIEKYFGFKPLIWNSNVTPKNKRMIWQKAISGEPCIILGTRSALFIPIANLGFIVVDEEHDSSYKQEEMGFYNARDMAVVLGYLKDIPVVLSSATPSLESHVNARSGKYGYIFVKNRFGTSDIADVELIDMRQCKFHGFISPILLKAIQKTIQKKEQCLIYLNRRGYSPITLCKSCGEKIACPNCSCWLVYHKNMDKLLCHYCGHKIKLPEKCLSCGEDNSYIQFGPGVERIFDELSKKFPNAKIKIASSDTISSDKQISELLTKIRNNDVDIVVGTQILAKGHHFPNITLVGVVDGDLGLDGADLRSAEKTYQLINQVSGRAGRAEKPGKILIQTFNPNHSLYVALKSKQEQDFIDLEINSRKEHALPPFAKFAAIIISGINKELTEKIAQKLAESCPRNGIIVYGPAPAPISLLRGRSRWRILLKSDKNFAINRIMRQWIHLQTIPKNIKIQIDIDPVSFL